MKSETPLQIAVFLDTRPGHVKQTFGILDALQRLTEIQTFQISLPHLSVHDEIMNWIKYFITPVTNRFADLAGCDFMIGTGARTHIPMLTSKKQYNIPAVTCMSPTPLLRGAFDLCFVPHHDRVAAAENIFLTNGPPNRSLSTGNHDPEQGLILIGGKDEKSHYWDTRSIIKSVSSLLIREKGIHWMISTSPRTPVETAVGLKELAADCTNARFMNFSDTGPGWIEKEYEKNKTVWVTADSMSMVFEALSAGCGVGLLPVNWRHPNNKFQHSAANLKRDGTVVTFEEWKNGEASWALSKPLNEARRCAEEILRRWWPDRLQ